MEAPTLCLEEPRLPWPRNLFREAIDSDALTRGLRVARKDQWNAGEIAVNVIDDRGNKLLVVKKLAEEEWGGARPE